MSGEPHDAGEAITIVDDGFPWSDSQIRIIAHRDGPLQITACAGSGKTLTISRKIAEMVHNGVDRNSIVAFTFTDNAAEELKVRIRRQMQIVNPDNPVLSRMHIGTIHSFCIELLHEFDPNTLSYDVLDDNKLIAFYYSIFSILDCINSNQDIQKINSKKLDGSLKILMR